MPVASTKGSTTARSATTDTATPTENGSAGRSGTRAKSGAKSSGGGKKTGNGGATPAGDGGRRLVIVESPAKARKIADYLGSRYIVESSRGHIRDLPRGAADVPAKYKGESWARLGVDVDNDFEPLYIVTPDKKSTVTELKDALKEVDELYLATDGDREGEAIAWHLLETLKPKVPVRRMVFHEITESAIQAAAANPRELDKDLVDAQETRRILDRLYGYEVSPVLWKKVMPKLSAGRVQSVATRVIVERERERMAFVSAGYWGIDAQLRATESKDDQAPRSFKASLTAVDGARVATGRDFDSLGQLKTQDVRRLDEGDARRLAEALADRDYTVSSVEEKPYTRKPYAPFMTSTLQQEGGRKLRFSAERTMRTAQRLYENGYITYMRTDSTTLSETAINAARNQARDLYGDENVAEKPRQYTRKVKNAQEAHEAIRPAGETFRTPGQVANELSGDEFRVYELIWQRTIASQMRDARGTTMSVRITGTAATGEECTFSASGRTITFPGFLRAYVETVDEEAGGEADDAERRLPRLAEGDACAADELTPEGHSTNPPARYTEASLVKTLEERGIGRPSTYASIINTIQERGYVWKKGSALVPSWIAFAVVGLMEQHFGRLVDYDFTAALEDELDAIAAGNAQRETWLSHFYFGANGSTGANGSNGSNGAAHGDGVEASMSNLGGLKKLVGDKLEGIDAREVNSLRMFADDQGRDVVVRVGRYGPYLERVVTEDGEEKSQRANLPEDLPPDELDLAHAEELFATPQEGRSLGTDPASGHEILAREGRYGPYVTEVLPEGDKSKPRTGSLFASMTLAEITLDDALKLLSLPRVVGTDPESGEEITAQNGRYGPYLKKGKDSRSLDSEEKLFTVTLEEAQKLYAQPKQRGRAAAKPPLKELGTDPASGNPMVVKDGRFGPYVTDGAGVNASLRKGDAVEGLTDERAAELLAEKRAKDGTKPTKAGAKKAPAKTTAAKTSTAKKTTAKSGTGSKGGRGTPTS
ncbi:DNA topoisomerase 1 [Actinomycetospora sp. NBRC 106375]|uniref:type I DNA topoisomerase n=1 Tax=Actinomycetospora sp. NBRC 106375 TaxID=3032207 RepID=UPI0024A5E4AD|nr:type I DNA topoisomerase [Actinomycetospora sp. NBRC 106375]GLZ49264.1 DNA topoisomerase 1 [Actinomycetospora sp. NBRC 106375]